MRPQAAMGERAWRLLRCSSPGEIATFWTVLIVLYLLLFILAMTFGIGYSQHIVWCGEKWCAVFDYQPLLWLPILFLQTPLPVDEWVYILWWYLLAGLFTEAVFVADRLVAGRKVRRPRERSAPPRPAARSVR